MDDHPCPRCERAVEAAFRFCPWCAAPQRRKLVALFQGHPDHEPDAQRLLRVSRYLSADPVERQVRVSVWDEDLRVAAAISLTDDDAERLAAFLVAGAAESVADEPTMRIQNP